MLGSHTTLVELQGPDISSASFLFAIQRRCLQVDGQSLFLVSYFLIFGTRAFKILMNPRSHNQLLEWSEDLNVAGGADSDSFI